MTKEQRIFSEGTKGLFEGIPPHVQSWAWAAAWKRFSAACELAREKHGAAEFDRLFAAEGPGYARLVMAEELIRASKDHNAMLE